MGGVFSLELGGDGDFYDATPQPSCNQDQEEITGLIHSRACSHEVDKITEQEKKQEQQRKPEIPITPRFRRGKNCLPWPVTAYPIELPDFSPFPENHDAPSDAKRMECHCLHF